MPRKHLHGESPRDKAQAMSEAVHRVVAKATDDFLKEVMFHVLVEPACFLIQDLAYEDQTLPYRRLHAALFQKLGFTLRAEANRTVAGDKLKLVCGKTPIAEAEWYLTPVTMRIQFTKICLVETPHVYPLEGWHADSPLWPWLVACISTARLLGTSLPQPTERSLYDLGFAVRRNHPSYSVPQQYRSFIESLEPVLSDQALLDRVWQQPEGSGRSGEGSGPVPVPQADLGAGQPAQEAAKASDGSVPEWSKRLEVVEALRREPPSMAEGQPDPTIGPVQ